MDQRVITISIGHWPVHVYLEKGTKYIDADAQYAASNGKLPWIFQQYIENIVLDDTQKKLVNAEFVGDLKVHAPIERYLNRAVVHLLQSDYNQDDTFGLESTVKHNCELYKQALESGDKEYLKIFQVFQSVLGLSDYPETKEDPELDDFAECIDKDDSGDSHTDNRYFIKVYNAEGQPNFTILGPNDDIFLNEDADAPVMEPIEKNIIANDAAEKSDKPRSFSWVVALILILIIVAIVLFLDSSIYTSKSEKQDERKW